MVKQLFDGKQGERTMKLDDVEADLRTMGIKRWEFHSKR
jgi:hypothetical protein